MASLALQETDVIGIRNIIDNVIFHQKEKHSKMELSYNFDKCVKPMVIITIIIPFSYFINYGINNYFIRVHSHLKSNTVDSKMEFNYSNINWMPFLG